MDISGYISQRAPAFLVGIGGVSMSALADLLLRRGITVRGSDVRESAAVAALRAEGIDVSIGHAAENIKGAAYLIRTAAAHDDNPEIAAARERGIPVFERAEAWGAIMAEHGAALCIAGTHGKTTATSMAVSIALEDGLDVTAMIGGELPGVGSHRTGNGSLIIAESCEYCNSFLHFRPTVAVVLNIEEDHLDFFSGIAEIRQSFRSFCELTPPDGTVVINADDQETVAALEGIDRRVVTFGIDSPTADVRAENLTCERGRWSFDIIHPGGLIPVSLSVPGRHNVTDALAAAAAMLELGADGISIARALASFRGAARRFEFKGSFAGADVYDDYAHHPSELRALFETARGCGYNRVIALFQPHTYSRTRALFSDFAEVLRMPDMSLILPIFPAREADDGSVSSEMLAAVSGCRALSFEEAEKFLRGELRDGDLLLTVGAGEAYRVAEALCGRAQ